MEQKRADLTKVIPGYTELIVRHTNGHKQQMVIEANPKQVQIAIDRARHLGDFRYRNGTLWASITMNSISVIACRPLFSDLGIGKDFDNLKSRIATLVTEQDE